MAKEYTNVKLIRGGNNGIGGGYIDLATIKPENIIFFSYWYDTLYDRPSECMGYFYQIAYIKDGEVIAELFNPDEWEVIGFFIEMHRKILVRYKNGYSINGIFFNKNLLKDLKIDNKNLIYKNKFKFSLEEFSMPLASLEQSKLYKKYNPKWSKDPLHSEQ